jgi:hypothetical protein
VIQVMHGARLLDGGNELLARGPAIGLVGLDVWGAGG